MASQLGSIFHRVCSPYRYNAELLLEELKKPEADIDEGKCLSLIRRGVNMKYKNWALINEGDSLIEDMAAAISGKPGVIPSDPEAFILACGKGKLKIVEAMVQNKIVHPGQWDCETGETGKIAAAKTGRLEVIKYLDKVIDDLRWAAPDRMSSVEEFREMNARRREADLLRRSSFQASRATADYKDYHGKNAYHYAKEGCHLDVMKYMLTKECDEYMERLDFRPSDSDYDEEVQSNKDLIQREIKEALQMAEQRGKAANPKPKDIQSPSPRTLIH